MSVRHDNGVPWLALLLAAACVTLLVLAGGCGGAPKQVRTALDVTATALVATDRIVADQYDARADSARAQSTTWAEYDEHMAGLNRAEAALRQTHTALLVAQSSVNAWDEGAAKDAKGALACVAEAVSELVASLDAAHIPVPSQVTTVLSLAPVFVGQCEHGGAP